MIEEIKSKKPNETAIKVLKDALNRAEKGDIQNIVIFGTDGEGCTFNQFSIEDSFMIILGESRLVERDIIDLHADIRKSVSWEFCE